MIQEFYSQVYTQQITQLKPYVHIKTCSKIVIVVLATINQVETI